MVKMFQKILWEAMISYENPVVLKTIKRRKMLRTPTKVIERVFLSSCFSLAIHTSFLWIFFCVIDFKKEEVPEESSRRKEKKKK